MWAQGMTVLLGLWLVASPDLMGYGGPPRINNQIVGVWLATFGAIAMSECMRGMRWANATLGVWLVAAPFALNYPDGRALGSVFAGVAGIALAVVRSPLSDRFGGGWPALWKEAE